MDDFVRNKLTRWGLSKWIDTFRDQDIDKESFLCLEDQDIDALFQQVGPRAKFRKYLQLLKNEQSTTSPGTVSAKVYASTSGTSDGGKRKLESTELQSPTRKPRLDTKPASYAEQKILSEVKKTMEGVLKNLQNCEDNKLITFVKQRIGELKTDKRKLVGVFGKTGAGKSSLINAIIGERNLLPSGSVSACTSVMIKVEANRQNAKYEAEIEFLTKKEWEEELQSLLNYLEDTDEENDEDDLDAAEKLSAVYGEKWKKKTCEDLMKEKHFKNTTEFLEKVEKSCDKAKELSAEVEKYTRSDSEDRESKGVKRWYWPLVKCVTVRVPDNPFLQHVTLVDLPGNGDCNKSRDQMWKGVIGSCSAVWVVTEMNRTASEKEAWEILESASSHMGNGGECQNIHFICTKSDQFAASNREQAKKKVKEKFKKLHQDRLKNHFSDGCFEVFTVSAKGFLEKEDQKAEDTEIPKLQALLQKLNDSHSETLNYVSGALGILSLIQGARHGRGTDNTDVCKELEKNMDEKLQDVRVSMENTCKVFEECLTDGVKESKTSWEKKLKLDLYPPKSKNSGFHRTLKCVVENGGTHKPRKGKEINLNMRLASSLTDSINDKFKKTFPNNDESGQFSGAINKFSLGTKEMMEEEEEKYKHLELLLTFLSTEAEQIKTKLNKTIRERKKIIYRSLITTIKGEMQECYERARVCRGEGSLDKMRKIIEEHVRVSADRMFDKAKDEMLKQLSDLMEEILKTLVETMKQSIKLIKTVDESIPDVTKDLEMVNQYLEQMGSTAD